MDVLEKREGVGLDTPCHGGISISSFYGKRRTSSYFLRSPFVLIGGGRPLPKFCF